MQSNLSMHLARRGRAKSKRGETVPVTSGWSGGAFSLALLSARQGTSPGIKAGAHLST